jgi:methionine-rich copper-binding protein CopC
MNKFAKAFAALALAVAAVLPSQAAFAHAELETSNPEANSVVGAAPKVVSLTFGEKLMVMEGDKEANQIQVTDGAGTRVDNGDYQVTGEVLTVSLKPDQADGTYKVTYRVVSEDGHPIEGVYEFEVNGMARSGVAIDSEGGMTVDDQTPMPVLYDAPAAEAPNGAAIGAGVAVGAVLVGGGMFFLFRKIRRSTQPAEKTDSESSND